MLTSLQDIFIDAATMMSARPGRTLSQGVGIALGAAMFVLSLGLGHTITHQVSASFDITEANTVTVQAADETTSHTAISPEDSPLDSFISPQALHHTATRPGINGIGRYATLTPQEVSAAPGHHLHPGQPTQLDVFIVDPRLQDVYQPTVSGYRFNSVDNHTARNVAMLGSAAAQRLDVTEPGAVVTLNGHQLTVIGIITDTVRIPHLQGGVLISQPLAQRIYNGAIPVRSTIAVVATKLGAADVVATDLDLSLNPGHRQALTIVPAPSSAALRHTVSKDVRALSLGAAILVQVVGTFAVANVMLLNVASRTGEIGTRRALGASPTDIVGMVLTESVAAAMVAGLFGTLTGVWILLGTCIAQGWSPVLDPVALAAGIAASAVAGVIGGAVPAVIAARVEPAAALRHR